MTRLEDLRSFLKNYYGEHGAGLLFHGWHHITFVTDKATVLAEEMGADVKIVATAALTHDLNYLVDPYSRMTEGQKLREDILTRHGYTREEVALVTLIVDQADLQSRNEDILLEAQVLSDADTLFKALPVSVPVFAGKYLTQTGIGIRQLASSIVKHQSPLFENGIYFYTAQYRERYMKWAEHNLRGWQYVLESLEEEDTCRMLESAGVKL